VPWARCSAWSWARLGLVERRTIALAVGARLRFGYAFTFFPCCARHGVAQRAIGVTFAPHASSLMEIVDNAIMARPGDGTPPDPAAVLGCARRRVVIAGWRLPVNRS
jgi:hypothetical protein